MGQSCSTCCSSQTTDGYQHTEQTMDDNVIKPERRTKNKQTTSSTVDSQNFENSSSDEDDSDISDDDYTASDANSLSHSLTPTTPTTPNTPNTPIAIKSKDVVIKGFKEAIISGNDSLASFYVDEYPDLAEELINLPFENGDTALHVAVKNKSYNLIVFLLTNGISPNAQNPENGETALHTAVRTRDVKVVTLLSGKYGADAKITNKNYESPLTIASDNNDHDIIELLAENTQQIMRDRLASSAVPIISAAFRLGSPQNTAEFEEDVNFVLDSDFEDNYDDDDKVDDLKQRYEPKSNTTHQKGKLLKIRQGNPFTNLTRINTKQALLEIQQIADAKDTLPVLAAWLEKKQSSMPYNYQKRWVICKGSHLLWSDKKRQILDPKNIKERKKFNNSLNLMTVKEIKAVTAGKSQRKFILSVKATSGKKKGKDYLWKCSTTQDRDYWVEGLQKHITHMKSVINYLGTK